MDSLPADVRQLVAEKYARVRELLDTKAKADPPDDPYRSKYAARALLCEIKAALYEWTERGGGGDCGPREKAALAGIYLTLGTVAMDVEETSTGEEHLSECLALLGDVQTHPDAVQCTLANYNQLGLLWSQRGDENKALEYLQKAEALYRTYNEQSAGPPTDLDKIFRGMDVEDLDTSGVLYEKTHTLTLYYLAQVYRKLNQTLKAAYYCHTTLARQMTSNDYDKIDWALNAATLSQFLLEKHAFREARHQLAAASHVLSLVKTQLDAVAVDSEQHLADKEQYEHRSSDVARCWAKYGIMLLSSSKNRLMQSESSNEFASVPKEVEGLVYSCLELEEYEGAVTCAYLLTYEDARPVFLNAQQWLNAALNYYTLTEHASDHIAIQQDMSRLYHALSFFEEDESRQCKMHKRRADILTSIVDQISSVHYLQACRELWYELGEVYMSIMDIKASQSQMKKHNQLVLKGLSYFKLFIDSFNNLRTGKLDEELPKEYERAILLAHLYSARLHTKLITQDKTILLNNNKAALGYYKFVVDYCKDKKEAGNLLEAELSVCKEMVNLLPHKIARIMKQLPA